MNNAYINRRAQGLGQVPVVVDQEGGQGNFNAEGFLSFTPIAGELNQFRDNISGDQNDSLQVSLNRSVNDNFGNVLQLGNYEAVATWQDSEGNNTFDLLLGRIPFAEGVTTSLDQIQNNGVISYTGPAFVTFSIDGALSSCDSPNCGMFSSTLNYGAGTLNDFSLSASTNTAQTTVNAATVQLNPDGSFDFDQAVGSFTIGGANPTNGSGVVAGGPFGANASHLGGVFTVQQGDNFAAGSFGGEGEPINPSGFHAAFLMKKVPVIGAAGGIETSVIAPDPYFNLPGDNSLEDGTSFRLSQFPEKGSLTFSVAQNAFGLGLPPRLVELQAFQEGQSGDGSNAIQISLRRAVTNQAFPSLEIGYYEVQSDFEATNGETYDFLESRFSFAEGFLTPEGEIARLAADQASFDYRGIAGGEIFLNGNTSVCDTPQCGTFQGTIDFGKAEARDFRIRFETPQASASIGTITPVGLSEDGHFVFNNSDGIYTIESANGDKFRSSGAINGAVFGGNAESTGGTYILIGPDGSDAFATGRFGGQR